MVPKAIDIGFLGVETPEPWLEVTRTAQDNSFLTSGGHASVTVLP